MKFLTLLASTLLIVLISQQSTSGLPVVQDVMDPMHAHVLPTTPLMVVAKRNDADRPKNTDDEDDEQVGGHQVNEKRTKDEKLDENTETTTKFSEFCPENYVRFEDSCLFVKPKNKTSGDISARVGLKENNLVQTFPALEDGSCPPGTEHTERGVCQKIISPTEMKPKHIERSCAGNARLIDGQCIVADEVSFTTISMPLETSESMKVRSVMVEDSIEPATRSLPVVDSEIPVESATRSFPTIDSERPIESETRSLPVVDSEKPVESATRSFPMIDSERPIESETRSLPVVDSEKPVESATRSFPMIDSERPIESETRSLPVVDSEKPVESATRSFPMIDSERPIESETRSLPVVDSEMPVESVTRSLPAVESDVVIGTATRGLPELESSTPFRRATRGLAISESVFPDKRRVRSGSVDDSDLEIEPATRSMPIVGSEFETTMESVHNH